MLTSKARMLRYLSPERAKLAWHFRRMANYTARMYAANYWREGVYPGWSQCCYNREADKAIDLLVETLGMKKEVYQISTQTMVLICLFLELAIMDGTIDP